jgi:hypothetical protein
MFGLRKSRAARPKLKPLKALTPVGTRAGHPRLPEGLAALVAEGFPVVDGPHYLDVFQALHKVLKPDWYLEIGTAYGKSLQRCPGDFVAIDPAFRLETFDMRTRQHGLFFQQTSDDFFASGFLSANGIVPGLGFLDGMHLFEYLLRDVMNFEKCAAPSSYAVLHDCLPFNAKMQARDEPQDIHFWTGDVWKTLVILRELRPDLTIRVLDAYPTGMVLITGFDPDSRVLDHAYEAQVARFKDMDITDFGVDAYFGPLEIESAHAVVKGLADTAGVTL